MATYLSNLERELALLTWTLRAIRMPPMEHATWVNGLRHRKPSVGVEARLDDLISELNKW